MFIPALSFLRMLGMVIGPLAWLAFGGAVAWFLVAIRRAPPDGPADEVDSRSSEPRTMAGPAPTHHPDG